MVSKEGKQHAMGSAQATLFYGNVSENFRLLGEHQNLFGRTEQKENKEDEWSQFPLCIGEKGREMYKMLPFENPETGTSPNGATV